MNACITKRELYGKIKDAFEAKTRIAVFAEYEEACSGKPEVSEKLRELNRYHNVNVALIVNQRYNDVDKEGKKLLVLDEATEKRRYRDSIINYKCGNELNEEMISVIEEWYGEHKVFVIVFCGSKPSFYYHELDNLRHKTECRAISNKVWDTLADSHFNSKRMVVKTLDWLISLARSR